jgi:dipeptidyl aminopeptidase/acylaminoacyl peptidase
LAFLSDPAAPGDFQPFIRNGDVLRALPTVDGLIESMHWSPDGTRILLGVAGRGADLAGCQGGATISRAADSAPAWAPTLETGDSENLWRHAWIYDLRADRIRKIGPARLNVWECCWLGPHQIAAVVSDSHGEGSWYRARLVGREDTYDYLRGIDALVERGVGDPARLGVTGISYGGFMSAWLVTQDQRFAAAVPISAVSDWYSQHRTSQIPYFDALFLDGAPSAPDGAFFRRSPAFFADRVRTPVLQLTGALDQNTPPTQALEFHRFLLEHDKTSACGISQPGCGSILYVFLHRAPK